MIPEHIDLKKKFPVVIMAGIMDFAYLHLYINTLLVINKPSGSLAGNVSINQNITGHIGNTNIQLSCSFISEAQEHIVWIQFYAKNTTHEFDLRKPIAFFEPNKPAKLMPSGNYLNGRVTMTNITSTSINATVTFHELKCEDEKDYLCQCYYTNNGVFMPTERSPPTRITVQTSSSKPYRISSIVVVSITTEMQGFSTSIYNNSMRTTKGDISPIDTVTTSQSSEKLPFIFREGDTVMFTCTGYIGNPPGKLIWQKTFPQGKEPITYSNETTYEVEIHGKCSFKGTSHLTVKIYAEDIQAIIRCFEESQVNASGKYLETEPLDVHFQVNQVDINKQPNQKQYDQRTNNITLNCTGNGNPRPTYVWFKKGQNDSILSNKSLYIIEDVIRNNSGVYICEVYNSIGDLNYRKSNSVEINIVHIDELQSSPDSATWKIVKEIVIPVICVFLFIVTLIAILKYCCKRSNRKDKEESCSRKYSLDGITLSSEYASVILPKNSTAVKKGDALVFNNGMDDRKSKTKEEDVTLDDTPNLHTSSFQSTLYADPSDALQPQNCTYNIPHCMTSFKNQENI